MQGLWQAVRLFPQLGHVARAVAVLARTSIIHFQSPELDDEAFGYLTLLPASVQKSLTVLCEKQHSRRSHPRGGISTFLKLTLRSGQPIPWRALRRPTHHSIARLATRSALKQQLPSYQVMLQPLSASAEPEHCSGLLSAVH